MEGQGQPDLGDDGTPKKKLHGKEIVDEQDAITQEPTSLNISDEVTNLRSAEIPQEKLQEKEVSDE